MRNFKWKNIPVNIPNTQKEWIFFSIITIGSTIISIYFMIFSLNESGS